MNKIKRLAAVYSKYIAVPWRSDAAAAQRVVFCIYDQHNELKLRAAIDEYELATKQAGHDWAKFDLTNTFAVWLASQKYAESYYQKPQLLPTLLPKYLNYLADEFSKFLSEQKAGENHVVALCGVGSLFGLLKVKDVVDKFAPLVSGRLLIFFPGTYENNNYRLFDAYDGWNYLAVPLTANND